MPESLKWRFAEGEIWGFEDLNEEEKQVALNEGCKPGRKYHGSPGEFQNEVPLCPICGRGFMYYRDVSCEHLVLVWDDENGEYMEVDHDFINYFWQCIFPRIRNSLCSQEIEEYEGLMECSLLPSYSDVANLVPDLVSCDVDDIVFFFSPIWGFASPTLLKEIREMKKQD